MPPSHRNMPKVKLQLVQERNDHSSLMHQVYTLDKESILRKDAKVNGKYCLRTVCAYAEPKATEASAGIDFLRSRPNQEDVVDPIGKQLQ